MDDPADNTALYEMLQDVNTSIMDGLGQLASYFGFSKVMGQLFGALLLSPGPLSLDDLMDRLGISKASVSTNMRTLEHLGIVREVWVRDDRRKYYQAEQDFWQILSSLLSNRELRDVNRALDVLKTNADRLQASAEELSEPDRQLAEHYIERLNQLQDFFRLAQLLLTSLIGHAQNRTDAGDIKRIEIE